MVFVSLRFVYTLAAGIYFIPPSALCAPLDAGHKHSLMRRPGPLLLDTLTHYLATARVQSSGGGTKLRTGDSTDANTGRLFDWLDRLIFGQNQAQHNKDQYEHDHDHEHEHHHDHDDYHYDGVHDEHSCHHDYDDYNTRFHSVNGHNGQSVFAQPHIQILPLPIAGAGGFMRPRPSHQSNTMLPAPVPSMSYGGFPFSDDRKSFNKEDFSVSVD